MRQALSFADCSPADYRERPSSGVVRIDGVELSLVDTAVQATGAVLLPFEEPSAMT